MAFISGITKRCTAPVFGPDDELIREACGSTKLRIIYELWDDRDHVIVGESVCEVCDSAFLWTRRATREERPLLVSHHQIVSGTMPGWFDVLSRPVLDDQGVVLNAGIDWP